MSEEHLIHHCAPTLAGIKTAGLFTCPYEDKNAVIDSIRQLNRRLKAKGLRILPLRFSGKKVLIYAYRPSMLSADLADAAAGELLARCGYASSRCGECVARLVRKLRTREDFPHEIGLFLGYPPEDVRGFMDFGPDCCKCTGCWKVYGDPEAAGKKFAQYKKCTRVYRDRWEKGRGLEQLTVSG